MSLPPEKLTELKQMIHSHLDRMDVHGKIKQYVSESMVEGDESIADEEGLLRDLRQKGIIDEVMSGLSFLGLQNKDEKQHKESGKREIRSAGKAPVSINDDEKSEIEFYIQKLGPVLNLYVMYMYILFPHNKTFTSNHILKIEK